MTPAVSFVVPCYNLAHLLSPCLQSILDQTFTDFEILVMDDCSPDDTPAVANSFHDPRVRHIRNEPNLGHLRNYNKGIGLARGKYIWLVSADDLLRSKYVLERYVEVLERNPRVGFCFCAGMGMQDNQEVGVLEWATCGEQDRIWRGEDFLARVAEKNCVIASSGIVRRECYDKTGLFPLDLPYSGDWYLWCMFAMDFDVAYFGEPMVSYRLHEVSMTTSAMTRLKKLHDLLEVPWRVMRASESRGYARAARNCAEFLATQYAYSVASGKFQTSDYAMTWEQFEESLAEHDSRGPLDQFLRSRVYSALGDRHYHRGELSQARQYYRLALRQKLVLPMIWSKLLLSLFGRFGTMVRRGLTGARAHS